MHMIKTINTSVTMLNVCMIKQHAVRYWHKLITSMQDIMECITSKQNIIQGLQRHVNGHFLPGTHDSTHGHSHCINLPTSMVLWDVNLHS